MNQMKEMAAPKRWNVLVAVSLLLAVSVQSVFVGGVTKPLSDDVRVQASLGSFLQGKLAQAANVVAETAADTEMGNDVATDLASANGPETLAEYCAGAPTEGEHHSTLKEGTKVQADWRDYGTKYDGVITRERQNGTVDVHYDDGFDEKRITPNNIKVVKNEKKKETQEAAKPRDDPACELNEFVMDLKKKFGELSDKLSLWLQAQRAKVAQGKSPDPPPSMTAPAETKASAAPAPAAAPEGMIAPSGDQTDELEKLKAQLADRDAFLKQLQEKEKANEEALQQYSEDEAAPASSAAKTVDDLIAEYKAKIAQRDEAIARLQLKIAQQEQELARLGAGQIKLEEINDRIDDLVKDAEKVKIKRAELEKAGKLDDELRFIVDEILKSIEKMRRKVLSLMELERHAKERKAHADREKAQEIVEAKADAAKQAKKEGRSQKEEDEMVKMAEDHVRDHHAEYKKEADMQTLEAAQEVEADLQDAEKRTNELDTGLHPHGAKWWRYRYEHSYIEAMVMIFIVVLYLIWNLVTQRAKHVFWLWSFPPGAEPKNVVQEMAEETHGAVYRLWLHSLGEQSLVCTLVFTTLWTIAQTPLLNVIPRLITPSSDMHVPSDGEEYKVLSFDMAQIFVVAIMMYYCIMFSVAHETAAMTTDLEEWNRKDTMNATPSIRTRTGTSASAAGVMGDADQWQSCKDHFSAHMAHEMQNTSSPEYVDIQRLLGGNFDRFPLWHYLRLNVRLEIVQLFTLTWRMWLPVVITFVFFMFLHRFAHMGYVRIMGCFGVFLLSMIMAMAWRVSSASKAIAAGTTPRDGLTPRRTIHNEYNTEGGWMIAMQFALFFLCYGVARTICQSWMWELHFWPVLILTILAIVSSLVFTWLVAPAIPSFCAIMAMPPYMDPTNIMLMKFVAEEVSEGKHGST